MTDLWQTKLAAFLHDPAEKALVLLRDPKGHEGGTVAQMKAWVELKNDDPQIVKRADHYASAADRPQFPRDTQGRFVPWTQVDFSKNPVLIHPLTGQSFDLGPLQEVLLEPLKAVSFDHLQSFIIQDDGGNIDYKKTFLALWRFAPTTPAQGLNLLWQNLPADTRVPDHSIWTHLDLASAFAGAMAGDAHQTPALLAVSLGPVQSFIAEARSTSDLWAGSHLLACLTWEGMKVICDELGPDAILFPQLRGIPFVDLWLQKEQKFPASFFEKEQWRRQASDSNPLFVACLPNRFVAIAPYGQTKRLTEAIKKGVQAFIQDLGSRTLEHLFNNASISEEERKSAHCHQQMKDQLKGFPEMHWASVPFSLAEKQEKDRFLASDEKIKEVLQEFYPNGVSGFLASPAWQVLQKEIDLGGAKFYVPNPGVLYPALYDLLDRMMAAVKSVRPFAALGQKGYRSSLNGEREWLTLDEEKLDLPPGQRKSTLWATIAENKPSWAKKGEHLDALSAIKRLWPTLFVEDIEMVIKRDLNRYVVSTHTMALAVSLERWLNENPRRRVPDKLKNLLGSFPKLDLAALPRRIALRLNPKDQEANDLCRKLPSLLDRVKELRQSTGEEGRQYEAMLRCAEDGMKELFASKPEAYYGMILFDGDKMGAWLSGTDPDFLLEYRQAWHPAIRQTVDEKFEESPAIQDYLKSKRAPSPSRHRVISEALNNFSQKLAPFVIEECFKGKLIYAGGDDVLAFMGVDDLLPAMTMLRAVYSGLPIPAWIQKRLDDATKDDATKKCYESNNGFVKLGSDRKKATASAPENEKIPPISNFITMGKKATASAGAIIAHHQAPLGYVLRCLREAESRAKNEGGRNAFCLRLLKRAGGEVSLTDKWQRNDQESPALLAGLMNLLGQEDVSRRAVYNTMGWLEKLPPHPSKEMLAYNLSYQFQRQTSDKGLKEKMATMAQELVRYVFLQSSQEEGKKEQTSSHLKNMLFVGEFLARESRFALEMPPTLVGAKP